MSVRNIRVEDWPADYVRLLVPGTVDYVIGRRCIEVRGGAYVSALTADAQDWQEAASVARSRLRRCKPWSPTWAWYSAVIAEADRRRRTALRVLPGGQR